MKRILPILLPVLLGFVLWTVMFSPWTAPHINFWVCMTISACLLTAIAFWQGGAWWKHLDIPQDGKLRYWLENIALGILIAIALWAVFWVGDKLSQLIFPSFARQEVDSIYEMKNGTETIILSLLLLFVIGPAEEIFWRGYIQRKLGGTFMAFALTTIIYALVHLFSLNFMLIMAALVCGVAWGGLYWLWPNRFPAILISHALWDAAVFVWFPIM